MKIAAVTDDGETISRHFGRAKYFVILTIEDGKITHREQVEKPAHSGHHHGQHDSGSNVQLLEEHDHHEHNHNHDHKGMFEPVEDCDIVLTRGMGRGAHQGLTALNVRPIITDIASIDDAVSACIDGTIIDHPEKLH